MKTIGLLGGMTCESSLEYYRLINEGVRAELGGIHSARSLMFSVDFAEIRPLMEQGDWTAVLQKLVEGALALERAGADFLVVCTNTMHKLAESLSASISIPLLNIIDATAEKIKEQNIGEVGLLGTRFTMTQNFYTDRLRERHDIRTIVPEADDIEQVHRVIMEELTIGRISPQSRDRYWRIIDGLRQRGAQGIILGCTEIPLLIKQDDGDIPLFDTTAIHAEAAVRLALEP